MHPSVDLLADDRAAETSRNLHRKPRLRPAFVDQDLPQSSACDHDTDCSGTRCHSSTGAATLCPLDNAGVPDVLDGVVAPPEPYWERLRRLRTKAGLSQPQLYRLVEGVGFDTIRAAERPYVDQRDGRRSAARYPSADMLEKLSEALGVHPSEFPEYRLAKARQMLDERAVGLEQALATLEQILSSESGPAEDPHVPGPPEGIAELLRPPADTPPHSEAEDA